MKTFRLKQCRPSSEVPGSQSSIVTNIRLRFTSATTGQEENVKDKTQVKNRKLVKDKRHVKKKQQTSKGEEKQAGKDRKVKSTKRREGHTRRMAFYRASALSKKDPQRYSAMITCHKYRNQPTHEWPMPKGKKRDANGVVRFAFDCSGLGIDAIATKQACHDHGTDRADQPNSS